MTDDPRTPPPVLGLTEPSLLDAPLDPAVIAKLLRTCEDLQRVTESLLTLAFYALQHEGAHTARDHIQDHMRRALEATRAARQTQQARLEGHVSANPYWQAGGHDG
jgi:hypothetical protein